MERQKRKELIERGELDPDQLEEENDDEEDEDGGAMPEDVFSNIFALLPPKDLASVRLVCAGT